MAKNDYVFDEHRHLSGFQMLFPNGEIKTAFLLTSLMAFTDKTIQTRDLRRLGLRPGKDYFLANAGSLRYDQYHRLIMRGQRVVLSLSGLLRLITQSRTAFGDDLLDWIYDVVMPSVVHGEAMDERDVMLQELRGVVDHMSQDMINMQHELNGTFGDIKLKDLINTAFETTEEEGKL